MYNRPLHLRQGNQLPHELDHNRLQIDQALQGRALSYIQSSPDFERVQTGEMTPSVFIEQVVASSPKEISSAVRVMCAVVLGAFIMNQGCAVSQVQVQGTEDGEDNIHVILGDEPMIIGAEQPAEIITKEKDEKSQCIPKIKPEEHVSFMQKQEADSLLRESAFHHLEVDFPGVEKALKMGADINFIDTDYYGFFCEERGCNEKLARILIENCVDAKRKTSLMRYSNLTLLKFLIDNGADIKARDREGRTALMLAAKWESYKLGKAEKVQFLIDNGADIEAKDNEGRTALMFAYDDPEIAKLLIDNGANINAEDNNGLSYSSLKSSLEFFNIDFSYRFDYQTIQEIIKNRSASCERIEKDARPLAVVIYTKHDPHLSFYRTQIHELIDYGYNVIYFEAEKEDEVYKALRSATYCKKADLFVLAGHGNKRSISMGAPDPAKHETGDETFNIDVSDEKEMIFHELRNCLSKRSIVILESCSTGEGKKGAKNVANMIGRIFPQAQVFAPAVNCGNPRYVYNKNGRVINLGCDAVFGAAYDEEENIYWLKPKKSDLKKDR